MARGRTPTTPFDLHPLLLAWLQDAAGVRVADVRLSEADWTQVLADADRHALSPLLHQQLERERGMQVPPGIREALKGRAAAIVARNLLIWSACRAILQAAQHQGLACVPLRGVVLGWQLHGNLTLRPTGDVDLLVKRSQFPEIRRILTQRGFSEVEVRPGFAAEFEYTLEFFKPHPMPLVVEPHWTIAYPPLTGALEMSAVWGRCIEGRVEGLPLTLLGPEDLLLHLCLHILHHGAAAPLLWFYELDRIVRAEEHRCKWPVFVEAATSAGLASLVQPVLRQIHTVFQSPIPETVFARLAERGRMEPKRRTLALVTQALDVNGRERVATLLELPEWSRKVRYAAGFLFPSPAFLRVQYGATGWRLGWVYVRRLGRFFVLGVRLAVRLILPRHRSDGF